MNAVADNRNLIWILLLVLLITIPFLNKPVHVDDTFVLHISQKILEDPFDPFAGEIDWFGHTSAVWEQTTNPPFASYWLAPFLLLGGGSEWLLHSSYIPFFLLLALGMHRLAKRFLPGRHPQALFTLMLSPAVVVSGNLMRDIPAAALATFGLALAVEGVDEDKTKIGCWGMFLLGLALLTKYSAAVLLLPLGIYLLLRQKIRYGLWMMIPVGILLAWCWFTWRAYGQAHPIYLLLERSSDPGIVWQDKLLSGLTVLGSSVFLIPLILRIGLAERRRLFTAAVTVLLAVIWIGSSKLYGGGTDVQFLFWSVSGAMLLLAASRTVRSDPDTIFLLSWLWCPFLFSVFFVPFQAVRHLLPALPALVILLFRYMGEPGTSAPGFRTGDRHRRWLAGLLIIQAGVALLVQVADYRYAASYRDFAARFAAESITRKASAIWFVGHWGWMYYADRAGYRQLHRDGPYPAVGDLLIWPEKVHIGNVFAAKSDLRKNLQEIETRSYQTLIPIRTLSIEARAGFYATIKRRIPYRLDWWTELESMRVYRVGSTQERK